MLLLIDASLSVHPPMPAFKLIAEKVDIEMIAESWIIFCTADCNCQCTLSCCPEPAQSRSLLSEAIIWT